MRLLITEALAYALTSLCLLTHFYFSVPTREMSLLATVMKAGIICSVLGGLANFRVDTVAGMAAVATLIYWGLGDLVWRTKAAQETLAVKSAWDHGTTWLTCAGIVVLPTIANITLWLRMSPHHERATASTILGFGTMLAGLLLRRWAMLELGSRFSRVLTTMKNHEVCRTGPYSVVRHPGYSANGLSFLGHAFLVTNGDLRILVLTAALFCGIYSARVSVEERMMRADPQLGPAYSAYSSSVRSKLVPFVY
jgi:protein-S-isoprenylcysteine O-methyltransferase Ste14